MIILYKISKLEPIHNMLSDMTHREAKYIIDYCKNYNTSSLKIIDVPINSLDMASESQIMFAILNDIYSNRNSHHVCAEQYRSVITMDIVFSFQVGEYMSSDQYKYDIKCSYLNRSELNKFKEKCCYRYVEERMNLTPKKP